MTDEIEGIHLTPNTVGLPTLSTYLAEIEKLIRGDEAASLLRKSTVGVEEGSLRIIVTVVAHLAESFGADMARLTKAAWDLDAIQQSRAQVLGNWQDQARKNPHRQYKLIADTSDRFDAFEISKETLFQHSLENSWVAVEKYLSGKVTNLGGKKRPNVHIVGRNGKSLIVAASESQLSEQSENHLYRHSTIRVTAEENLVTRELRNLQLIEFCSASTTVDEQGLERLWNRGKAAWSDVEDVSDWIAEIRGH